MSGHASLKARTGFAHETVDTLFSRFDLGGQESYVHFLLAHGRVLPGIEAALRHQGLPRWQSRTGLLAHDLAAFGYGLPVPIEVPSGPSLARQTGLLYVIEGSRLGGRLLSRRVRPGLSAEFLSAFHEPGAWRAFTRALDARAGLEGTAWLEEVVGGALHGFALYAAAAEELLASAH
jgi:heme oxygenase